jgi:hypothetical protein
MFYLEILRKHLRMSCLVESVAEAMKNLPILGTYTGADGMKYRGDSNLEDVCHLAETIRRVCNLAIDDLSSIQSLSKQQVIEIVELVVPIQYNITAALLR